MEYTEWIQTHPIIASSNNLDLMGENAPYFNEVKRLSRRRHINKMSPQKIIDEVSFFTPKGANITFDGFIEYLDSLSKYETFQLNHIFFLMKSNILLLDKGKNTPKIAILNYEILIEDIPSFDYSIVNDPKGKIFSFIRRYQLSIIRPSKDLLTIRNYALERKKVILDSIIIRG